MFFFKLRDLVHFQGKVCYLLFRDYQMFGKFAKFVLAFCAIQYTVQWKNSFQKKLQLNSEKKL